MTDPNESVWIEIEAENPWWTSKLNGFRWGPESDDKTEYAIPELNALTDTGTSCIIGPSKPLNSIIGSILKTSDSVISDSSWGYIFDCADKKKMPSFELLFGGYWMRVNTEDYVIDISEDKTTCTLCLSPEYEDEWILGDAYMRGWYSMHDLTNMKAGFHSIDTAKKPTPTKATSVPTKKLPNDTFDYQD